MCSNCEPHCEDFFWHDECENCHPTGTYTLVIENVGEILSNVLHRITLGVYDEGMDGTLEDILLRIEDELRKAES